MTFNDKGIENKKTGKKGKLIVKFRIVMPIFTDEQLDMWENFFDKHKLWSIENFQSTIVGVFGEEEKEGEIREGGKWV